MKTWVALVALGLATVGAAAGADGATLVLDENAYWRYYIQWGIDRMDPKLLRADGEKVLGPDGFARLEKTVDRWSRPPYVAAGEEPDLDSVDWRDRAVWFITQVANCGCDDTRISFHSASPPPPADWARPDFDAAVWMRQRSPLLVGNVPTRGMGHGTGEMKQPLVRAAFYRTHFEVTDPSKAHTLSLVFRGGVRVLVNGEEIARSHLPTSERPADAMGVGYPREAYVCLDDEVNAVWVDKTKRRVRDFVPFCPDLVGDAEKAFVKDRASDGTYHQNIINRAGWDRVKTLRDRTLGPVTIPSRLLRKGTNLLAVELRPAGLHPVVVAGQGGDWGRSYWMGADFTWAHARLMKVALRSADDKAPTAMARPAGVAVWAEDPNRRMYGPDFGDEASRREKVRIVGAANATCAGQVVVSTDRALKGLTAAVTALASDAGAEIPASAVKVMHFVPEPVTKMITLGQWRGLPEIVNNPVCTTSWMALYRHGPAAVRESEASDEEVIAMLEELTFFDHLTDTPPKEVPADSCQPIWLSVRIPSATPPGVYRGSVTVSAEGLDPVRVSIEAEVVGWHCPSPRQFQTFFAGEQCPYGVSKHYGVADWSDEHFRLMAASFAELARLGARWVFVPVIQTTEFGNLGDSPIRWFREKDGSFSFDYSILDRYLDLAGKHLGPPEVICFVVCHGTDAGDPASVAVTDRATGKTDKLDLSKKSPDYEKDWTAFAVSLHEHLKQRGQEETLYWGYGWDGIGDADLIPLLAEAVPTAVRWARGSHAPNRAPGGWVNAFTASSFIYGVDIDETSRRGWKQDDIILVNPRAGCSVVSANGHSPPFAYRMLAERALVAGCRGVARIGADYWDGVFYRGYSGRAWPGALPGMGCLSLLWPGPDGAQPSQRGELLLEGIQEGEARIFLEQALDAGRLDDALVAKVRDVLRRHQQETLYVPVGRIGIQITEYPADWQNRSRRLYAAAAEVAKALPMDVERDAIKADVPARSVAAVKLSVRNWTAGPRKWAATSDQPWLKVEDPRREARVAGGELAGIGDLPVRIDTTSMEAGQTAEGTVTITDAASGKAWPVKVTATVGQVFQFVVGHAYDYLGHPGHASSWGPRRIDDVATFNVPVGGSETRRFVFINHSGRELSFKIDSPAAWMKVSPVTGRLPARGRTTVDVTAAPTDKAAARHAVALEVRESDGPARQAAAMDVYVIPPYARPAEPTGQAVRLAALGTARALEHRSRAYWYGTSDRGRDDYGPKFDDEGNIVGGTPQLTVYDIEDKGFTAFSATAQVSGRRNRTRESPADKIVNFEVYVDDKLAAQSGPMAPGDEPRRIVAPIASGAKRLKLLVRWDRPEAKYLGGTVGTSWMDPKLCKP